MSCLNSHYINIAIKQIYKLYKRVPRDFFLFPSVFAFNLFYCHLSYTCMVTSCHCLNVCNGLYNHTDKGDFTLLSFYKLFMQTEQLFLIAKSECTYCKSAHALHIYFFLTHFGVVTSRQRDVTYNAIACCHFRCQHVVTLLQMALPGHNGKYKR